MSDVTIDPRGVRLLLIDADVTRRATLADELREEGYGTVFEFDTPEEAVALRAVSLDVLLVDLDAPGVTRESLDALRGVFSSPPPPVIGLTCETTAEGRARAVALGAHDIGLHPLSLPELNLRVNNALAGGRLRRLLTDRSARLTEALRERTAEQDTMRECLGVLAAMADYHDDDSDHHAQRVGIVSSAIAQALGLPETLVEMIRDAAPLHDIGKVGIARRILLKPGKLTPSEWLHMQQHVDIGGQILASAQAPVLQLAAEIARTHHEQWSGAGYTAGLAGEEIPIAGRIVAVADVWDTLTHDRPYRKAWEREQALAEIRGQAGSHFDPAVVEAFCSLDLHRLDGPGDASLVA